MDISTSFRARIAEAIRTDDAAALDTALKYWLAGVLSDAKSTENAPEKHRYCRCSKDITE